MGLDARGGQFSQRGEGSREASGIVGNVTRIGGDREVAIDAALFCSGDDEFPGDLIHLRA